jgi:hypothetical protein
LAWHGDIDRLSTGAAVSYIEDLLIIRESLGETTKDAAFIWRTAGGDMHAGRCSAVFIRQAKQRHQHAKAAFPMTV